MIDRRAFVGSAALIAVAPLAAPARLPAPSLPAPERSAPCVVLLIDGWSASGDTATPEQSDHLWVKVDRSWRTAWC